MHCSASAALSAAGNHGGSGPDGVLTRIRVSQASGERGCGERRPMEPGLLDGRNWLEDRRPAPPQAQGIWRPPCTYLAAASLQQCAGCSGRVPLHLFTGNQVGLEEESTTIRSHSRIAGSWSLPPETPTCVTFSEKTDSWVCSPACSPRMRTVSFTLWVGDIHRW